MHFISSVALLACSSISWATPSVTQIFNFTTYIDIENSHLRPNGQMLFSTFSNASIYTIDPAASSPSAELVAHLPGATAATGIASIGADKYAIIGGVRGSYMYANETIYILDFSQNSTVPSISVAATLPDAVMLNGMAALPSSPTVVLACDSRLGAIWRIDTTTGNVTQPVLSTLLQSPENATIPIGVNGLKVLGKYVYFTNTERFTYGRIPISATGEQDGEIEILATMSAAEQAAGYDWDDFELDAETGTAFMATPGTPSLIMSVAMDGTQSVALNSSVLVNPTSLTIAADKSVYVTTRGDGSAISGQIVKVEGLIAA